MRKPIAALSSSLSPRWSSLPTFSSPAPNSAAAAASSKNPKTQNPPINHFFHKQISKNRLGFIQPPNMRPTPKKKTRKKKKKEKKKKTDVAVIIFFSSSYWIGNGKDQERDLYQGKKRSSHKEKGPSGTHPQQGMWRRCALDLSLEVNLKGAQRSLHKIITWTK